MCTELHFAKSSSQQFSVSGPPITTPPSFCVHILFSKSEIIFYITKSNTSPSTQCLMSMITNIWLEYNISNRNDAVTITKQSLWMAVNVNSKSVWENSEMTSKENLTLERVKDGLMWIRPWFGSDLGHIWPTVRCCLGFLTHLSSQPLWTTTTTTRATCCAGQCFNIFLIRKPGLSSFLQCFANMLHLLFCVSFSFFFLNIALVFKGKLLLFTEEKGKSTPY